MRCQEAGIDGRGSDVPCVPGASRRGNVTAMCAHFLPALSDDVAPLACCMPRVPPGDFGDAATPPSPRCTPRVKHACAPKCIRILKLSARIRWIQWPASLQRVYRWRRGTNLSAVNGNSALSLTRNTSRPRNCQRNWTRSGRVCVSVCTRGAPM